MTFGAADSGSHCILAHRWHEPAGYACNWSRYDCRDLVRRLRGHGDVDAVTSRAVRKFIDPRLQVGVDISRGEGGQREELGALPAP